MLNEPDDGGAMCSNTGNFPEISGAVQFDSELIYFGGFQSAGPEVGSSFKYLFIGLGFSRYTAEVPASDLGPQKG